MAEGSPNGRGRGRGGRGRPRSRGMPILNSEILPVRCSFCCVRGMTYHGSECYRGYMRNILSNIWLHSSSGNGFVSAEHEDGGWDRNRGYARGRGRGRGRGSRGRGGYNGPQIDRQQDGGYNYEAPIQGGHSRGRGRGGYNGPQIDRQQDGGYNYEAPPQGGRGGFSPFLFIFTKF